MKKTVKSTDVLDKVVVKADIGIAAKDTQEAANYLQKLLADEHVLYVKTRNYHWNVEGVNFMQLHLFYERLYTELADTIDEIAERIRKIGHYAQGRMIDFLQQADLLEGEYTNDSKEQLIYLLEDHETMIRNIRSAITKADEEWKDVGTEDFLTGLLQKHEEWAWFLRSYTK